MVATVEIEVQLPLLKEQELELYGSAWAIILARRAGDLEASDVSFQCAIGARQDAQPLPPLRLGFDPETRVGDFVRNTKQKLGDLAKSTWPNSNLKNATCATSIIIADIPEVNIEITSSHQRDGSDIESRVLIGQLEQTVSQLSTLDASTLVRDVQIFSAADEQCILQWNSTPPPSVNETLCSLFAQQVQIRPNAPAICSWDMNLSYAELDVLSKNLAGELVRRGVVGEDAANQDIIALCLDKSAVTIITMLAILRAGSCFAHLGITNPIQRQAQFLTTCKAKFLIVDKSNIERLTDHKSLVEGFVVDETFIRALPDLSDALPEPTPSHAAAITFTSGSTGTPKGIVVEHGSIATTSEGMCAPDRVNVGPHTRTFQFSAYTFDVSVGDVFYALTRGGCVCSPSEQERISDLAATVTRLEANWAFFTPSVLSLLEPKDVPTLRTLLVGGESPSQKHIDLWASDPTVSVHLIMGPAECAIYCSVTNAFVAGRDNAANLGRPAGCRMWAVDPNDHTKLAPIGCPGEMIVEGRNVARGYLRDPEKTNRVFLDGAPWQPPLPTEASQFLPSVKRLYKSGDLVRFHANDGTFSFIARKDNQVKIHGQRVELDEIEHHLEAAIPGSDTAVVLLNTASQHSKKYPLISFLSFAKDSAAVKEAQSRPTLQLTAEGKDVLHQSKENLLKVIPSYMIPTLFIPIPAIPFSMNGKKDVATLRQIAQNLTQEELLAFSLTEASTQSTTRPLTSQEEQLRDLWVEVLSTNPADITPDSDFIQEGGDSLTSMQLVTAAARNNIHLPVSIIISQPRLSDMALKMGTLDTSSQDAVPDNFSLIKQTVDVPSLKARCATVCKIDVDQISDVYPSTSPQAMLLGAALMSKPGTYVLRVTFQLPTSVSLDKFISAWDTMTQSAEIVRTRLVKDEDAGAVQVVTKGFQWDHYNDLKEFEAEEFPRMDFGTPLTRLGVVKNSPGGTPVFVFTMHHALYDAFSLNIIFAEVSKLYTTGKPTPLAPFKNYVRYISRLPLQKCLSYWTSALANSPAPFWPKRVTPGHLTSDTIREHLPIRTRPHEFTLAIFAQAAFSLLYSAKSSADDIIFCMSFSGREVEIPAILDTAGPTLFTVPFRTKISRKESIFTLLDSIRQTILTVAEYGHIGLPAIVRSTPDAANAVDFRALFAVHPKGLEMDEEVFGKKLSYQEEMGRMPLLFECWVAEGGLDLVAEYNTSSLEKEEVEEFVTKFRNLLPMLVEMDWETSINDVSVS